MVTTGFSVNYNLYNYDVGEKIYKTHINMEVYVNT